ncbi:MAG: DUF1824 family protein [Cyanobacteria bacterium J06638_28]
MTSSDLSSADIPTVRKQLTRFSCLEVAPTLADAETQAVREALLLFNELSEYQTLGICADDLATAKAATEAYVAVLSRPIQLDLEPRNGPVFLKFNTLKGAWYLDDYPGPSRGVLVSFHTTEPEMDAVNGTYGPFPLDLFD